MPAPLVSGSTARGRTGSGFSPRRTAAARFDRLDGLDIATLTVEDAGESVPDLGFRWIRLPFEEGDRRKHHGASRVARLNGTGLDERFLHRVESAAGDVDSFDRRDVVAVCFGGEEDVTRDKMTVTGRPAAPVSPVSEPNRTLDEPFSAKHVQ